MREVLISSSVLILVLVALRRLLRGRISLRIQYALWLLVAVRLLVPIQIGHSDISVLNLTNRAVEAVVTTSDPAMTDPVQSDIPQQGAENLGTVPGQLQGNTAGEPAYPGVSTIAPEPDVPAGRGISLLQGVWLAGCAAATLWFLSVNVRFRRRTKAGAKRVEVDSPLPVYVSEQVSSPCLVGLIRPRVYVTPACLADSRTLRHVLAHEETHWHHRDPWWALVRCLCLCIYWFDPLVWWAAALSRRDGELSCDEGAVRRLGEEERLAYGRTLVDLVTQGRIPLLQTATTMAEKRSGLRERVALLVSRPRTLATAAVCLLLVMCLTVGCTFTGAGEPKTLQEKLVDLPKDLADLVEVEEGFEDPDHLVSYHAAASGGLEGESYGGWLLDVYRMTPGTFEHTFYAADSSGWHPAARVDAGYYAYQTPTDVQWEPEFLEAFLALQDTLEDWVREQILAEEGAEPFTDEDVGTVLRAPFTYPGAHRWMKYYPYLALNGSYQGAMTLTLSQPATKGKNGIWCVERWYDENNVCYLWYPQDTDLSAADYYAQLQAQADAGEADWALDPQEAAFRMVKQWYSWNDTYTVVEDSLHDQTITDHLDEYGLWVFPSWEKDYLEDGTVDEDGIFEIMGEKIVPFTEEKADYFARPENEAVMATGVKYFILAAHGEQERCDAMEAQPVDETALVDQPLYSRKVNYIHAPEYLGEGRYRLRLEYLLMGQSGDTPPEERQVAELILVGEGETFLVEQFLLTSGSSYSGN